MKLDKIQVVGEHKILQVREIQDSGGYHRRILTPDSDVSSESSKIQEQAHQVWTNEVKDKYASHKEQQEKQRLERFNSE